MKLSTVGCSVFPSLFGLLRLMMIAVGMILGHGSVAQGWELTFGGARYDDGNAIAEAVDGGFILVGFSESFGDDGDLDVYVVRTDIDGKVLWQQYYDPGFTEHGFDVLAEPDGTFLVVGDMSVSSGAPLNVLLMRIGREGDLIWSRRYAAPGREVGKTVCRTNDGGYLIAGTTAPSADGEDDILLLKVDALGNPQWRKTLGGPGDDRAVSVITLADGYVVAANVDNPQGIDSDIVLYKIDENGEKSWPREVRIATAEADEAKDLLLARDGDLILAGRMGFNSDAYLARLSPEGSIRWEKKFGGALGDIANSVIELPSGELVIAGQSEVSESNPDVLLAGFDRDGNELWRSVIGDPDFSEEAKQIVPTIDGKYALVGLKTAAFLAQLDNLYLAKTDDRGNIITNFVSGRVYRDADSGCNGYDLTRDTPLNDWLVRVSNEQRTYFGTTDAEGYYRIRVDTGSYTVSLLPVNSYWRSCVESYEVTLENFYDSTTFNFPVLAETICPYLEVDVSTAFLAPCSDVVYTVSYCNIGPAVARDAYVEVTLDSELEFRTAGLPLAGQNGNVYTFSLGNIASTDCGSFTISTRLPCSGIAEGQAGLVSARIYPDTLCVEPDPNWDRSSIIVSGDCDPARTDPVIFRIKNVGKGNMRQSRRAIVTQDDLILLQGDYSLLAEADTVIRIGDGEYSPGATYRIIAQQSEFHPGRSFPTLAIEGCVEGGEPYTTGIVAMFPEDDLDPYIAIDVQEITSSAGATLLKGHPKGYRDSLIAPTTDLTYTIYFRNVGTDTIDRVVIRDTLPGNLDITTVTPGAGSHPYIFEIYENGILRITFSDIGLTPRGSNGDPGSYGFVKFRVSQKLNNPVGTVIENRAAIFFDYLAPVRTNAVRYFVGDFPSYIDVISSVENPGFWPGVKINAYPNPFIDAVTFNIEGHSFKRVTLNVFDVSGRLLHTSSHNGNEIMYYRQNLPAGLYFYRLESEGQLINSGKLMVR